MVASGVWYQHITWVMGGIAGSFKGDGTASSRPVQICWVCVDPAPYKSTVFAGSGAGFGVGGSGGNGATTAVLCRSVSEIGVWWYWLYSPYLVLVVGYGFPVWAYAYLVLIFGYMPTCRCMPPAPSVAVAQVLATKTHKPCTFQPYTPAPNPQTLNPSTPPVYAVPGTNAPFRYATYLRRAWYQRTVLRCSTYGTGRYYRTVLHWY